MKNTLKTFVVLISVIAVFGICGFASAQNGISAAGNKLGETNRPTGLSGDINLTVSNIVSAALFLVSTIFLILVVYAGVTWMTAYGNQDRVEKSKKMLIAAVIGLIVTMSSYAITAFFIERLGGTAGVGEEKTSEGECYVNVSTGAGCYHTELLDGSAATCDVYRSDLVKTSDTCPEPYMCCQPQ